MDIDSKECLDIIHEKGFERSDVFSIKAAGDENDIHNVLVPRSTPSIELFLLNWYLDLHTINNEIEQKGIYSETWINCITGKQCSIFYKVNHPSELGSSYIYECNIDEYEAFMDRRQEIINFYKKEVINAG